MDEDVRKGREMRLKAGNALMAVLEAVPELRPYRCRTHEQAVATCVDEAEECGWDEWEPYETAMLAEFVLVVDWVMPTSDPLDDGRAAEVFLSPHLPRTHAVGLLSTALDEL